SGLALGVLPVLLTLLRKAVRTSEPRDTFRSRCAPGLLRRGATRPRSGVRRRTAGRPGQNGRHVLEELRASVERPVGPLVEGNVWIRIVDPLTPGTPRDDGKDDHPETIDQTGRKERTAEGEAADRAHRLGIALLQPAHDLHRIVCHETRV